MAIQATPIQHRRRRVGLSDAGTVVIYVLLTVWAILCLFPIYWMIKNSFEPNKLIAVWPPAVLPIWDKLTLDNFVFLVREYPVLVWFFNSALVTVVRTAGAVFFGSMAGYAFAKLRFFARDAIFWIMMPVLMVPGFVLIIPQFEMIRAFHWIDTYWALMIPGVTGGVWAMFLMRQFMHSVPTELMESAHIYGASEPVIFLWIVFPLALPGAAVLAIFSFIGSWNSFLYPLIITTTKLMRTLPVGLSMLTSPKGMVTPIGQIMAGATISAVPIITMFLFFQRYFLKGITVGALKG
jgi:multiple sugar transport system permease protein